jgi:hypothetical protein
MVRTALFALLLALGGTQSFGSFGNIVTIWATDEVDVGSIWDPWGGAGASSTVGPDGSGADIDAGNIWDPFG